MRDINFPAMEEFEPFPIHTLVPKRETGVDRFLAKHNEHNGSGVVIAIFDTGIDPSAAGLQVRSHGDSIKRAVTLFNSKPQAVNVRYLT